MLDRRRSTAQLLSLGKRRSIINGEKLHVPRRCKIFYKFWWSEELTILKQDAVETDRAWKAARRPRFGPIFDKRQRSRLKYRKCIRECQNRSTLVYTNDLHDALLRKMELSFGNVGVQIFSQ